MQRSLVSVLTSALAALTVLASSADARADDENVAATPAAAVPQMYSTSRPLRFRDADHEEGVRRWYGWQTLTVDGASLLFTPVLVGAPGLVFGAPIVHAAHHNWGAAAGSFGMRAGGFGLVFAVAARNLGRGDFGGLAFAIEGGIGALVVHSIATAIDAAVLAYDDGPVNERAREREAKAGGIRLLPSIGPQPGGGWSAGLGAAF